MSGTSGDNLLIGGPNGNILTGGGGSDTFVYNSPADQLDSITDFAGDDLLQFSASGFGGGLAEGISLTAQDSTTGVFVANTDPISMGSSANFLHNTSTGDISFDADGTGIGTAVSILNLQNAPTLSINQIQIIA